MAAASEYEANVSDLLAKGGNVHYVVLQGGSHSETWQIAYTIENIRDWLFIQSK
jgi:predicted peptidase